MIPATNSGMIADELRTFLRRTLPDAAIPVEFVAVETFPLTSNGKVDRRALSDAGKPPAPNSAPPQNALERSISAVWSEVIGDAGEIGVNENFFDLGGTRSRHRAPRRLERALHGRFHSPPFPVPTIRSCRVSRLRSQVHRLCGITNAHSASASLAHSGRLRTRK